AIEVFFLVLASALVHYPGRTGTELGKRADYGRPEQAIFELCCFPGSATPVGPAIISRIQESRTEGRLPSKPCIRLGVRSAPASGHGHAMRIRNLPRIASVFAERLAGRSKTPKRTRCAGKV